MRVLVFGAAFKARLVVDRARAMKHRQSRPARPRAKVIVEGVCLENDLTLVRRTSRCRPRFSGRGDQTPTCLLLESRMGESGQTPLRGQLQTAL
jgi:hypothetical protein